MATRQHSLLIVIVNYRTPELTIDCLRSLDAERIAGAGFRAVVVDAASGDESSARLAEAIAREPWDDWASLMPLDRNGGFSYANNAAIRPALESDDPPRYVLLLNPDTVVRPGAVDALTRFMDRTPDAGIAGSRLEAPDGRVQPSAHPMPTPWRELDRAARIALVSRWLRSRALPLTPREHPQPCDWISGASFIVRREVLESIGLLDEGFFLYYDEVDFCTRARRAGWSVWRVPESRVMHIEGAATGINQRRRLAGYWYDSRRRFFVKTHGVTGLLAADLCWSLGHLLLWIRRLVPARRRPCEAPRWAMLDLLWGDLKALLSGRLFRIRRQGGTP